MSEKTAPKKTDEIERQFWQHQGVQIVFILLLLVLSLVLPKIPLLRGWEYKLTAASVEVGKSEIPIQATRIKSTDEALVLFPSKNIYLRDVLKLNGPLPIAAWSCKLLGQPGLCVRYLWKNNDPLTLVVTAATKRAKETMSPFTKSGWSGYIIVTHDLAVAISGPADPDEILGMVPR